MEEIGKKLAQRAITRASSGLYFIEDILRYRGDSTDGAFSRSWYLLLSFNFELILNSLIAFESKGSTNEEVIKDITSIRPSHDFEKLFQNISPELLKKVGLVSVKKQSKGGFIEYEVMVHDGSKIYVQDLIDVRYDFKKDDLREPDPHEIPRIKAELKSLRSVVGVVKELAWSVDAK
jgi:hypothetical protein